MFLFGPPAAAIGIVLWRYWALAPVLLVTESLAPWAACKRSAQLIRGPGGRQLNDMLGPLWLIGWLVMGPLLGGVLFVLESTVGLPAAYSSASLLLVALLLIYGGVFVAPLKALGVFHFYHYLREHPLATDMSD
jgi:hypothetical protein